MPLIAFVGDLHGEIVSMYNQLQKWEERTGSKIDAIVQVGDFGIFPRGTTWSSMFYKREAAPIPTWVVPGNHESPKAIGDWQEAPNQIPNMKLMPDGQISHVLNVRIGAIWGNFSPISWLDPGRVRRNRETGDSERIAMHILRDSVEQLLTLDQPMDVLVTHETACSTLPSSFFGRPMDSFIKGLLGLEENEQVAGCPEFNKVLKHFKPPHYFFGHLHCFDEGIVGATHYTCLNAINYPGGPWFKLVKFDDFNLEVPHEASVPVGELVA